MVTEALRVGKNTQESIQWGEVSQAECCQLRAGPAGGEMSRKAT